MSGSRLLSVALCAAVGLGGVGSISPAPAQDYPARVMLSTGKTVTGETIVYPTNAPAKVTAAIIEIAPGASTPWHRHDVPLFAFILDGEITVDYGAKGTRIYRRGEALMEALGVAHQGRSTGSVPVRILAVYMGAEGREDVTLEPR